MNPPPPVTPEQLLAHARSLRALARGLLLDDAAADDVVQEAWVQALERPPLHGERLGGWLHTVVRSLAWKRHRGESRRTRRESTVARPEALPSAAESVESAALCQRLANAVMQLREPYRSAISLRYFDELPAREIAERLGLPKNTVRSHLRRGLAELRQTLDSDSDSSRGSWRSSLAIFAQGARMDGPMNPAAPSGGEAFVRIGELLAMIGIGKGIVTAGLILSGGLWWFWGDAGSSVALQPVALGGEEASNPSLALMPEVDEQEARRELAAESAAVKRPALPSDGPDAAFRHRVTGLVVDVWGRPMPYCNVGLAFAGVRLNLVASTAIDGTFDFDFGSRSRSLEASVGVWSGSQRASGMRTRTLVVGQPAEWHFVLPRVSDAGDLSRTLRDALGKRGVSGDAVRFVSECGRNLELPPSLEFIEMDGEISDHNESDPTPPEPSLEGVVHRADGEPAVGALVGAIREGASGGAWVFADDEGRWRLNDLAPGNYRLQAGGDDFGLAQSSLVVGDEPGSFWEPTLDRGLEVFGRLLNEDDEPLRGWRVQVEPIDPGVPWSDTTLTDGDGRFACPNALDVPYRLSAFAPGTWGRIPAHVESDLFAAGSAWRVQIPKLRLPLSTTSVVLRDARGEPVLDGRVRLTELSSGRAVFLEEEDRSEEPGRYLAAALPAGSYRLEIGSSSLGWLDEIALHITAAQDHELGSFTFPAPGVLELTWEPDELRDNPLWTLVRLGELIPTFAWSGPPTMDWEWAELEVPGWAKVQLPAGEYALCIPRTEGEAFWERVVVPMGETARLRVPLEDL